MDFSKKNIYDSNLENIKQDTTQYFAEKYIGNEEKVLDVGCATGYFGQYLKQNKNCSIVGTDYSLDELEKAKEKNVYDELLLCDLNKDIDILLKYEKYFDKIVILDVLEHLYNPEKVLKNLLKLLSDNGELVISVPNIIHQSVKLAMLLNKIEYKKSDLLDYTHLRFFTIKTFAELLLDCKLRINDIKVVFSQNLKLDSDIDLLLLPDDIRTFVLQSPCASHYQYIFNVSEFHGDDNTLFQINEKFINEIYNNKNNKIILNDFGYIFLKILLAFIPSRKLRTKVKSFFVI